MVSELLNFIKKIGKDNIAGASAMSCFYIIMCVFPFALLLLSLLHMLPFSENEVIKFFSDYAPVTFEPVVTSIVKDLYSNSSLTLVSVTTIAAIWAAGNGFSSIVLNLNIIYEKEYKGNWLLLRLTSILYTILLILGIVLLLVLNVFGEKILYLLNVIAPTMGLLFSSILHNKTIFIPTFLILLFLIMYIFIPNRKTNLLSELPGAIVSAVSWSVFSYVYSLYVNNSQRFSIIYGSLASLIFAFFWIYFCLMFFYFGAELNNFIQKIINRDKN